MDGVLLRSLARNASAFIAFVALIAMALAGYFYTHTPEPTASSTSSPYWIANNAGSVWNFGGAVDYGDMDNQKLNKPIVGITPTNSKKGYWLVATDGGIFSFGDAAFYGSTGALKLNKPIVGMAPTPGGKGYWMVASDGGIFTFGDGSFYGSTGALKLNKPIVAMEATPSGKGYWLIASDGGIFSFGDAKFWGSTGALSLNKPIVAMESTPSGNGYWLVSSDGGIFSFGDAKFFGSGASTGGDNFSRIVTTSNGQGYWLVRNGGDALGFGNAIGTNNVGTTAQGETSIPAFALVYNINGPGDLAVQFAMGERGKPYLWGGNGPLAYDCSGLTVAAWKQAGVSLPRIANDQYDIGKKVPLTAMQPGDLVFWGTDPTNSRTIYHVAIYIGGGNVVMAPKSNDVVKVAAIWQQDLMPLAVRPR